MEENNRNKTLNKDTLKWVIVGLACLIILVLAFGLGVWVGTRKAEFSYRWAESYHQNFGGPKQGFVVGWREFPAGDLIEGHGSFGEIIKIDDNSFVIKGRDNTENIILLKDDTVIEKLRKQIKPEILKVGDFIVVIGSPNDSGQIEAKLIRVIPSPMSFLPPNSNNRPNK